MIIASRLFQRKSIAANLKCLMPTHEQSALAAAAAYPTASLPAKRYLIGRYPEAVAEVPLTGTAAFTDVDTPEALEAVKAELEKT